MRAYLGSMAGDDVNPWADRITILDIDGAAITAVGEAKAANPTYLARSDDCNVLYAVAELKHGKAQAFGVTGSGLEPLGQPQATGAGPTNLTVHPSGRFLLTANYQGGTITVLPIKPDSSLDATSDTVTHHGSGPVERRQQSPHVHMVTVDPGTGPNRGHVLAADLGTDTVYRYTLDTATGKLHLFDELHTVPGAGPRHLVVHDKYAYVANELDSTVTVFDLDAGARVHQVSTRPEGSTEHSAPSAIRLSRDGKFLYVANRFVNEIAQLSVDGPTVSLLDAAPCGGDAPRDIVLSPDGGYLYACNVTSGTVTTLRVDQRTGKVHPQDTAFRGPGASCIVWG